MIDNYIINNNGKITDVPLLDYTDVLGILNALNQGDVVVLQSASAIPHILSDTGINVNKIFDYSGVGEYSPSIIIKEGYILNPEQILAVSEIINQIINNFSNANAFIR